MSGPPLSLGSAADRPAREPSASRLPPPWIAWYRRAFPAYFLFLFLVNHFPGLKLPKVPGDDKLAHATAFALLAFLAWRFWEAFRPIRSARFAPLLGIALMGYAAFDEWTQQFVLRGTDINDWFADIGGIIVMIALLEAIRRWRAGRGTTVKSPE